MIFSSFIETVKAKEPDTVELIDNFVEELQLPDFCQSKEMHVKAKIRQFLREDEVEKSIESNNWFLIRVEEDIQLATQELQTVDGSDLKAEKNAEIGDQITVDNCSGELLCSSSSGFGVMDIFSYVLTEMNDLRSFLGHDNCDNSDKLPSLIIKSYLKFCSIINHSIWEPKVAGYEYGYEDHEEPADFDEPTYPDFEEQNLPRASTPVPSDKRKSMRFRKAETKTTHESDDNDEILPESPEYRGFGGKFGERDDEWVKNKSRKEQEIF